MPLKSQQALRASGKCLSRKPPPFSSAKMNAGEAPLGILEPADVVDIDLQKIARLGALDRKGTAQVVHFGEIHVPDVVGGVVVLDLPAGPVVGLDPELVARLETLHHGNIRMPAVVGLGFLILGPLVHLGPEYCLCHDVILPCG
jgi:hypothetical protein